MDCQLKVSKEILDMVVDTFNGDKDLAQKLCSLSIEELKKVREAVELMNLLGKQSIPSQSEQKAIDLILGLYLERGTYWAASNAYIFGYIQGKRAERARRKLVIK